MLKRTETFFLTFNKNTSWEMFFTTLFYIEISVLTEKIAHAEKQICSYYRKIISLDDCKKLFILLEQSVLIICTDLARIFIINTEYFCKIKSFLLAFYLTVIVHKINRFFYSELVQLVARRVFYILQKFPSLKEYCFAVFFFK